MTTARLKFLFPLIMILTACSVEYKLNDKHFARPVDSNVFTYKKRDFHLQAIVIDTTKIYCNAYPTDKPEYYDCYRFFENGRLLSYRFFGKIDTAAFADINFGGIGYYHIRGNEIRTQELTVYAEHFKKNGGGRLIHFTELLTQMELGSILKASFLRAIFFTRS